MARFTAPRTFRFCRSRLGAASTPTFAHFWCGARDEPGRQFEVMFRLYGPEKPFFDRQWVLPDIEPMSTVGRGG